MIEHLTQHNHVKYKLDKKNMSHMPLVDNLCDLRDPQTEVAEIVLRINGCHDPLVQQEIHRGGKEDLQETDS